MFVMLFLLLILILSKMIKREELQPVIPKIIHYTWKDSNLLDLQKECLQSWKTHFKEPEYIYMFWSDEDISSFINTYYEDYKWLFDKQTKNIVKVDLFRFFVLHKYGGIYMDLDYKVHKNFYSILKPDKFNCIESPFKFNEEVQNSLMACVKNHTIFMEIFNSLKNNNSRSILSIAGPTFLTNVLKKQPKHFHILPCNEFQRIQEKELKAYKNNKLLKNACGKQSDNVSVYGEHLLSGTWI